MNEPNPHPKVPSQRLLLPPDQPAEREEREPPRRLLAGYVLSYEISRKLNCAISASPMPPTTPDCLVYPLPHSMEKKLRKDLRSRGLDFRVDIRLAGPEIPYSIIIAAQGCYRFRGPAPELAEGKEEEAIREWLESKGSLSTSFHHTFLPCLQELLRRSTDGRSPLTRQLLVVLRSPVAPTLNPSVLYFCFLVECIPSQKLQARSLSKN
jgi:hypothetical protein